MTKNILNITLNMHFIYHVMTITNSCDQLLEEISSLKDLPVTIRIKTNWIIYK